MSPALQKILSDLSPRNLMRSGKGYTAMCPAHEDNRNSLSIGEGSDGKVLLKCHAGCELAAICEAGGWSMADLFPQPARGALNIVATYEYRDENGELLSQVVRLEPKSFRQRRPDGNGGWVYQLGDVRRVLYRLSELRKKKAVVFVEGEKDADALWKLKIPATTNLGGASAWRPELVENLKWAGVKRVVILPDNDAPGRKHSRAIARDCHAAGIEVTICELPGLPDKGDVSDFLAAAQYPKGDLVRAVQENGKRYEGDEPDAPEQDDNWLIGGQGLNEDPLEYLVEGMIPLGMLGSISGRDRRGKTLLGLEIAKSVLTGEKLFGEFEVRKGTVYLVLLDDPENLISDRLKKLGIFGHPDLRVKALRQLEGKNWDDHKLEVLKDLSADLSRRGPTFVLIDALYLFVPTGGKSGSDQGNSSGAMTPIMEAFDNICRQSKATVGVVIHNNKADTDLSGSQSIRNMLKWILMLSLPKKYDKDRHAARITPDRLLQLDKIKMGGANEWGLRIVARPEGGARWEMVDLAELEKIDTKKRKTERRQKMVEWIRFFLEPGARTSTEVYAAGWEDWKYTKRELESPDFADAAGIEKYHPSHEAPWYWRLRENNG